MTYFSEFWKLKKKNPHIGIRGFKNMNSDFNDYLYFSKNCYMCFSADKFWDCFYCQEGNALKNCTDCSECDRCELCYECLNCRDCFDGTFLQDCRRVSESMFCYDCVGCNQCFGCSGIRQKNFCVFNEQFTKEEYAAKVCEWKAKGMAAVWAEFARLKGKTIHQHAMMYRAENSTGDHLENVKNAISCFSSGNLQDCGYCYRLYKDDSERIADTYDSYGGIDQDLCYECINVGDSYDSSFLYYCEVLRNCDYCFQVFNSKYCFLCCGVNHGEFMILNKKFGSLEEWSREREKVIEQMKLDGEYGKWMVPEGEKIDC